jgi:hypothetical protein
MTLAYAPRVLVQAGLEAIGGSVEVGRTAPAKEVDGVLPAILAERHLEAYRAIIAFRQLIRG